MHWHLTDEALDELRRAIDVNPDFALALSNRSWAYRIRNELEQADRDCARALEIDPQLAEPYVQRAALANLRERPLDEVRADANRAVELNPRLAFAYLARGGVYWRQRRHDLALADYNHALQLEPGNSDLFVSRGSLFKIMGQPARALEDFDQAARLNLRNSLVSFNRGTIYHDRGDYDKARAEYDAAIRLNPRNGSAWGNRGMVHLELEDYRRAIEDLTEAIRLKPSALHYTNRGALTTPSLTMSAWWRALRRWRTSWSSSSRIGRRTSCRSCTAFGSSACSFPRCLTAFVTEPAIGGSPSEFRDDE